MIPADGGALPATRDRADHRPSHASRGNLLKVGFGFGWALPERFGRVSIDCQFSSSIETSSKDERHFRASLVRPGASTLESVPRIRDPGGHRDGITDPQITGGRREERFSRLVGGGAQRFTDRHDQLRAGGNRNLGRNPD